MTKNTLRLSLPNARVLMICSEPAWDPSAYRKYLWRKTWSRYGFLRYVVRVIHPGILDSVAPGGFQTYAKEWRSIRAGIMRLGFLGRPGCVITLSPLDFFDPIGLHWQDAFSVFSDEVHCFFAPVARFSPEVFEEVCLNEGMKMDKIIIAGLMVPDFARVLGLVKECQVSTVESPRTTEEFIRAAKDGCCLKWVNPSHSVEEIIEEARGLALAAGWEFEIDRG